ncbi:MAG: DmsC/YnfH family molybdoenzyme membrane anchor subunit [Xanthomonadales bacterium]|jgi:anaerobic dimethyl sulfoxide reductase subunit C (anchor subunit)|nr:DmsC/YnfH family molybdoenzyme membrane anchor subunit [Xanthomonadales bacterium]
MPSRDWSLVFFTVLAQWSVGIIVCLTVLVETEPTAGNPVLLALFLIAVATVSSFLHLGTPSNAPGALNNLSASWLSREILAIAIFSGSLLITLVPGWMTGGAAYPGYLLLACSITGLFLLWAMARVYLIPTIPSWNSWYTPLSFATTSLSLGLITFLLLNTLGLAGADKQEDSFFAGVLVAILALEMLSAILHQRQLLRMDTGIAGPTFGHGAYYRLFLARMTLILLACLALLFLYIQADRDHVAWIYLVLLLVTLQEFAGRRLFYSSYFRIGV